MNYKNLKTIQIKPKEAFDLWRLVTSKGNFSSAIKSRLFDAFGGIESEYYKFWVRSQE